MMNTMSLTDYILYLNFISYNRKSFFMSQYKILSYDYLRLEMTQKISSCRSSSWLNVANWMQVWWQISSKKTP